MKTVQSISLFNKNVDSRNQRKQTFKNAKI